MIQTDGVERIDVCNVVRLTSRHCNAITRMYDITYRNYVEFKVTIVIESRTRNFNVDII